MCCGGNCTGNCSGCKGNFTYVRFASDNQGTNMSKYKDKNNSGDLDDIERCYQSIFVSPIQLDENGTLFPTHFTEWAYICDDDCGCGSEGCTWFDYHVTEEGNRWSWNAGVLTIDSQHTFQNIIEGEGMTNGDVMTIPFFKDANGDLIQSGVNYCFEMVVDPSLFTSPDSSVSVQFGTGLGATVLTFDQTQNPDTIKSTITAVNGLISAHTMVIKLINHTTSGTEIIDFRIVNFRLAPESCCNPIVHVSDVKLNEVGDEIEVWFSDDHVTTIPVRTNLSQFVNDAGFITNAPNFATDDLVLTGNRTHNTNGHSLEITTGIGDNGSYLHLAVMQTQYGFKNADINFSYNLVSLRSDVSNATLQMSTGTVALGYNHSSPFIAGARLDVKAQGALSTDKAFRVRNSSNTSNLFEILGNGAVYGSGLNSFSLGVNGGSIGSEGNFTIGSLGYGSNFVLNIIGNSETYLRFHHVSGNYASLGYFGSTGLMLFSNLSSNLSSWTGETFRIGINSSSTNVQNSSALQVESTTQGFLPPRMTTAQRTAIPSPAEGLCVYDLDLRKLCVFTTAWEVVTSV